MIKNIIFDFGGVLLDLDAERCKNAFRAIGLPEVATLLGLAHQQGVIGEIECGEGSLAAFCDALRTLHGCTYCTPDGRPLPTPSNRDIVAAFCSMADGIPAYRLDFLQRLKEEGYHLSALSNTNYIHWGYCLRYFVEAGYLPDELFEHVFLSCDLHLAKPDRRIFEAALDTSHYAPADTLYVDDNPANCAAAASLGLATYCAPLRTDWTRSFHSYLL